MSTDRGDQQIKSAYQVALEKLAEQGVSPPVPEGFSPTIRRSMDEVRTRAEASLAELEILHRDRMRKTADPGERAEAERSYQSERRRIEDRRDRELARLRESE